MKKFFPLGMEVGLFDFQNLLLIFVPQGVKLLKFVYINSFIDKESALEVRNNFGCKDDENSSFFTK